MWHWLTTSDFLAVHSQQHCGMGADDEVIVNVQVVSCAGSLRLNAMSVTAASVISVCTHINFLFLDGMLGGWRAVGASVSSHISICKHTRR